MKISTSTTLAPAHYTKSSDSAISGQITVERSAEGSLIEVSDDGVGLDPSLRWSALARLAALGAVDAAALHGLVRGHAA